MKRVKGTRYRGPFLALAVLVVAPGSWLAVSSRATTVTILLASIEEQPPINPADVANREVALRLVLAAAPDCTAAPTPAYGFLIDADSKAKSGTQLPGVKGLGFDARVSAECVSGELVSPGRTTNVTTDASSQTTTIEIITTVGMLPSVDFDWVAYALEGDTWSFFPPTSASAHWTTAEIESF